VTWRVLLREIGRGLWAGRQRSGLAALGIVVGVASVIAITSTAAMVRRQAAAEFRDLGADAIGVHWDPASGRALRAQELRLLRGAVPGLVEIEPVVRGSGTVTAEGRRWTWDVVGVSPGFARELRLRLAEGRFLSPLDRSATFCVVGHQVAEALRGDSPAPLVGRKVTVGGRLMVIAGVLARTAPSPVLDLAPDRAVFLPAGAAARLGLGSIGGVLGRLAPGSDPARAGVAIRDFFRRRADGLEVEVRSAEELLARMSRQLRLMTLLFGVVGAIALVLGGVGVMNVMILVVDERRHEIGVRRSLGASRREIGRQFLGEATGLALVGAVLGIVLGAALAWGIGRVAGWGYALSPTGVALGAVAALVLGVGCGTFPARRAARLSPIDALRG